MMKNLEVSIIIHGPLDVHTILSIYQYHTKYNIIIVGPKPSNSYVFDILNSIAQSDEFNVSMITYGDILKDHYDNKQNKYYQFYSLDCALKLCNTEYVIKLRSDEFYSNLDLFVHSIKNNKSKIITNDVFFRKCSFLKFHPSDHLIGGKTEILSKIYSMARKYCESIEDIKDNLLVQKEKLNPAELVSEQILGISTISQILEEDIISALTPIEIMKQVFDIVKSENLGNFLVSSNSVGVGEKWSNKNYYKPLTDVDDINEYI